MVIEYSARTDPGKVRTNNEDSYFVDDQIGLFLVADGMGGHKSGELASKMAVEVIAKSLREALAGVRQEDRTQIMFGPNNPDLSEHANQVLSSIRLANQVIYETGRKYPQNQGMGTTVVAVLFRDNHYIIGWVGDSRVYLIRHGQIQQLSTDHSLVQEQVSKGLITSAQAETSEFKNILTRALGAAPSVEPEVLELAAFKGDYLILCSDGLTRMVHDQEILETVDVLRKPQDIGDRLISLANAAGGRDNVTVLTLSQRPEGFWGRIFKSPGKQQ